MFAVTAIDATGNTSAPVSRTWIVDTTPPTVTVTGGPSGTTTATSATFTVTTSDGTLSCVLDGAATSCAGAHDNLADGPHTFTATAADAVGNISAPVSRSWTVSTPAQVPSGPDPGQTGGGGTGTPGTTVPAAVPRVLGTLYYKFATRGAKTTIVTLKLTGLTAPKTSVTVTCKGKGCRFSSLKAKLGNTRTLDVRKLLRHAALKAGQVLTVKLSAPGYRAKAATFTVRRGKAPKGGAFGPA
jgi:hypothetical protein